MVPLLMGVVNVTPDSFADGGRYLAADAAVAHARAMIAEGADILDVGGESTRPGHTPVDAETEVARALPVIAALAGADVPISIDTSKADVARAAIGAGARTVNDVWGLRRDPDMAAVCAEAGVDVIVMHNRDRIDAAIDILADIDRAFDVSLGLAARAGIAPGRVILDPGIGFGKTPEQSLAALSALPRWRARGHRVLIGASRKRVIGHLTGRAVEDRLAGTLAAHLFAAAHGAAILRVHDVAAHRDALAVQAALA